ncbi:MAG: hypothetical protein JXR71_06810 [Bacteroidales bacterium]|nr:hypothetical protein [Bacteroidales bacterium]
MNRKTKKTVGLLGKIFMILALVGLLLFKKIHQREVRQQRYNTEQVVKARKEYQKYRDSLRIVRQKVVRDSLYDAQRKEMQKKRRQMQENIIRLEKEIKSK